MHAPQVIRLVVRLAPQVIAPPEVDQRALEDGKRGLQAADIGPKAAELASGYVMLVFVDDRLGLDRVREALKGVDEVGALVVHLAKLSLDLCGALQERVEDAGQLLQSLFELRSGRHALSVTRAHTGCRFPRCWARTEPLEGLLQVGDGTGEAMAAFCRAILFARAWWRLPFSCLRGAVLQTCVVTRGRLLVNVVRPSTSPG